MSKTPLKAWPEGGAPAQVWRRPIGEGFSGITISGNHLLTAFGDGKTEFIGAFERATGGLFAVDITTGKQIWNVLLTDKLKIKRPLRGFSTSPIVMGDTLIIHGGGPSLSQIIAMPVFVSPNRVFISSSVENGCLLIQALPDGNVETEYGQRYRSMDIDNIHCPLMPSCVQAY